MEKNIILIGMPGCGKSTVGVLLAKSLGMDFYDSDLQIQKNESMLLCEILKHKGNAYFLKAEEKALIDCSHLSKTVIATGGSAVFCSDGMDKLKENAFCIFIDVPVFELEKRIKNITTRGVVIEHGQTLLDVYKIRNPLYERYTDITIKYKENMNAEDVVNKIISELRS